MRYVLWAAVTLIAVFLVANLWAGSSSTTTLVSLARSRCVEEGFPAQTMQVTEMTIDTGLFGFGGRATVEFAADGSLGPDGKRRVEPLVLRVELRRRMNLLDWEVARVSHEP